MSPLLLSTVVQRQLQRLPASTAAALNVKAARSNSMTRCLCSRSSKRLVWALSHTSSTRRTANLHSPRARKRQRLLRKAKSDPARQARVRNLQAIQRTQNRWLQTNLTTLSSSFSFNSTIRSAGRSTRASIVSLPTKTLSLHSTRGHPRASKAKSYQKVSASMTASGSSIGQKSCRKQTHGTATGVLITSKPSKRSKSTTSLQFLSSILSDSEATMQSKTLWLISQSKVSIWANLLSPESAHLIDPFTICLRYQTIKANFLRVTILHTRWIEETGTTLMIIKCAVSLSKIRSSVALLIFFSTSAVVSILSK